MKYSQLVMQFPRGASLPVPASPVVVRMATGADGAALAALLSAAFPEAEWTAERCRAGLLEAADVAAVYVIEGEDGLIGTASARYWERFPDRGYVHWVAVDPTHRGRRLSHALIAAVLRRFADDDRLPALLETDDERHAAIAAYLGLGFVPAYVDEGHELRWSRIFRELNTQRNREGR